MTVVVKRRLPVLIAFSEAVSSARVKPKSRRSGVLAFPSGEGAPKGRMRSAGAAFYGPRGSSFAPQMSLISRLRRQLPPGEAKNGGAITV